MEGILLIASVTQTAISEGTAVKTRPLHAQDVCTLTTCALLAAMLTKFFRRIISESKITGNY